MARDLPSLDWLRVFATCASSHSFAIAAGKLGVTAGAVSQRIKALENFVGVALFDRMPQGVRLTAAGRSYAQLVDGPIEQLVAATRQVSSNSATAPLRITILPALAQLWLGPRLDDFHRQHRNAQIEIWADAAVIDLRNSPFDLAIRYGEPPFAGCDYHQILRDEIVPVASPGLLATARLDAKGLPEGVPLNADSFWADDFDEWRSKAGAEKPAGMAVRSFSLYSMVVEATLNGQGFMIGHTSLVSDLIREGGLVPLSDTRVATAKQFYVLRPSGSAPSAAAQSFIDWVTALEG